jgi:hypothetical protein
VTGAVTVRVTAADAEEPVEPAPHGRPVLRSAQWCEATVAPAHPERVRLRGEQRYVLQEAGLTTRVRARAQVVSTADALAVDLRLDVTHQGEPFFHRRWRETIPRHLL